MRRDDPLVFVGLQPGIANMEIKMRWGFLLFVCFSRKLRMELLWPSYTVAGHTSKVYLPPQRCLHTAFIVPLFMMSRVRSA